MNEHASDEGTRPATHERGDPGAVAPERAIDHERGIPSVNRIRSIQSRVTALLAAVFVGVLALGGLAWYYSHEWRNRHAVRGLAESMALQRGQGETRLPPLPRLSPSHNKSSGTNLWGTSPQAPPHSSEPAVPMAYRPRSSMSSVTESPDPRLTGPVLSQEGDSGSDSSPDRRSGTSAATLDAQRTGGTSIESRTSTAVGNARLGELLMPTVTPASYAHVLPTQRLLLPKGWKIDCTLETAIDSSLQGLVTCLTPVDIFGADGSTVLLPRGTQLVGETRGEARQGLARVFVLWTQARTPPPDGVVAMLDSPGTDELGRSGLPGHVNRHFFERFSAAILVSVIEGAVQRAARPDGGTVIVNPTASTSIATEVLKSTINIPPVVLKHNGDRIQILVARDVDFRSVYELRPTAER